MPDGRIIKGQPDAQLTPDLEFIPNVGPRTILRRDFTNYNEARNHAAGLSAAGFRSSVRQKGEAPIWTVESSFEGDPNDPDSDLQNTHELRANVLNPDWKSNLYTHSLFTASPAGASMAYLERKANAIKSDDVDYNTVRNELVDDATSPIQAADFVLCQSLLDDLLAGNDTFIDFQYVYTHTFNFGSQRDYIPDHFGVRSIFTPGGLISDENVPALLGIDDVGGEWLKLPPEVTDMYGGRRILKYEYWWAEQWNPRQYPLAGV
jgi:hypothetical protein